MKGIIVVDIPETCLECNYCGEIDEGTLACCTIVPDEKSMYGRRVIDADYCQDKPDWCPINPVPDKVSEIDELIFVPSRYAEGYMDGWNDCIDKILKGEENE